MKNITKQYQDLLEGKMSKENFMRSVRRDFPQWIAPVNSFKDAVNILKSKRILTEADAGGHSGPIKGESQAGAIHIAKMWDSLSDKAREDVIQAAGTFHDFEDVEKLAGMDFDAMMGAMPAGQGSINKLYSAIKQAAEDESTFSQMQANRGFNPTFPGQGSTLEGITEVSDDTVEQDIKNLRAMGYTYKDAITATAAILDMDYDELADEYPQDRIDTEGHEDLQGPEDDAERGDFDDWRQGLREAVPGSTPNQTFRNPEILAKAVAAKHGEELKQKKSEGYKQFEHAALSHAFDMMLDAGMPQVVVKNLTYGLADEDWPSDYVTALNQSLQGSLNEAAEKPEGRYKEATGKAEYDKFAEMDRVNYRQLMKGMEFELLKMPEITDENLIKAKKKAYSNLIKNPKAYLDLLVRNEKEVEKKDKDLRMQAVKKDNLADKANAMKVLKKDEGSNTQTNQSNKEKAKGMPEGVKVMKESFVEQLRNYILSEMVEVGSPKTSFRIGEMVKTPEGDVGTVEEVTPDNTAKIKLESGAVVEYQGNVLEAYEADQMMQEDEPTMEENVQLPDLRKMWNSMSTEEKINSLKRNKFLDKKTDDVYAELANLSFEDLFYQDTEARKRYKIAPYAALLQGLLFPQSTPTQAVGSEKNDLDKNVALKEKLVKGLKKEVAKVTDEKGDIVKLATSTGEAQQFVSSQPPAVKSKLKVRP